MVEQFFYAHYIIFHMDRAAAKTISFIVSLCMSVWVFLCVCVCTLGFKCSRGACNKVSSGWVACTTRVIAVPQLYSTLPYIYCSLLYWLTLTPDTSLAWQHTKHRAGVYIGNIYWELRGLVRSRNASPKQIFYYDLYYLLLKAKNYITYANKIHD